MPYLKQWKDKGGYDTLATPTQDILVYAQEKQGKVIVEVYQKGKSRNDKILDASVKKRPA